MKQKHCDGYPWDFHCTMKPEFSIKNGPGTDYYCRGCFEEAVFDLVTSNSEITFQQTDGKAFEVS